MELVTLVELDSGESVYVASVHFDLLQAIRRKARETYPDVDPTLYEVLIEPELGTVIPAEHNEEYRRLVNEAENNRERLVQASVLENVVLGTPDGKEATIAKYAERVANWRKVADLPTDDWQATVQACLIRTPNDKGNIVKAALNLMPVTGEEIANSFRVVRLVLQQKTLVGNPRKQKPQSAEETKQDNAE